MRSDIQNDSGKQISKELIALLVIIGIAVLAMLGRLMGIL